MLSSSRWSFAGRSMQLWPIESFHEYRRRNTGVTRLQRIPCYRHQMTHTRRFGRRFLPMAACQAGRRPRPAYVGFSRYFIFPNRRRASDNGSGAGVAGKD